MRSNTSTFRRLTASILLLVTAIIISVSTVAAQTSTIAVTDANAEAQGWGITPFLVGAAAQSPATDYIVEAAAPTGTGSYETAIPTEGSKIILGRTDFVDTPLADITALEFVSSTTNTATWYLNVYVSSGCTGAWDDRLDFQLTTVPADGAYRTVDALTAPVIATLGNYANLAAYLVAFPNACITDGFDLGDGIGPTLVMNYGDTNTLHDGETGRLDTFRIAIAGGSDTTWDFEPATPVTPDVTVSKAFNAPAIADGLTSNMEITLTNNNSYGLFDITLQETVPTGLTISFVDNNTCANPPPPGGSDDTPEITGGTVATFSGFSLLPNASCTLLVTVDETGADTQYVNNQTNITSFSGFANGEEVLISPGTFSATLDILATGDVSKAFSASSANIGETVTMTLSIGVAIDDTVSYTDALPAIFGNPADAGTEQTGAGCTFGLSGTTTLLGTITEDGSGNGICAQLVTVECVSAGTATNTAEFTINSGTPVSASADFTCIDPTPPASDDDDDDGDDDEEETTVDATAAVVTDSIADTPSSQGLLIDIEAEPNVISGTGANVTWTVTVTNATDSAFDPGQLVTEIDSQFGLLSATGSQGSSEISGNQVLTQTGVIDPSTPLVLVIESVYNGASAAVPEGAAAQIDGDLCGTGTISGQSDTDCVTILPPELPDTGGDAPPQSIPAWLLLAGLIGLLGGGLAWKVAARKA